MGIMAIGIVMNVGVNIGKGRHTQKGNEGDLWKREGNEQIVIDH